MLKLEQLAALVVAAGLAIVSYLLFFSWAGGGGYERRQRNEPQALLSSGAAEVKARLSPCSASACCRRRQGWPDGRALPGS